ncbi:hypothetical protein PFISCL1PPCAC_13679, partial [Pristionchus fissidentatus]
LGLCLNMAALYIVSKKSGKQITEYRKLLILFLIADFIFTIAHEVFKPIITLDGNLLIFYLSGPFNYRIYICYYCGLISMIFVLIAFHFVYRAMAISRHSFIHLELNWVRLLAIVIILATECTAWAEYLHTQFAYE